MVHIVMPSYVVSIGLFMIKSRISLVLFWCKDEEDNISIVPVTLFKIRGRKDGKSKKIKDEEMVEDAKEGDNRLVDKDIIRTSVFDISPAFIKTFLRNIAHYN